MSVNFAGWTGNNTYSDYFINQGTKDYAKSKGINDINTPLNSGDLQALESHFQDFSINGEASSNTLQNALMCDKLAKDPKAERAAILTLCNPQLLNILDGNDHNSVWVDNDMQRVISGKQNTGKIYDAVNKFANNSNVLDYFETNAAHGNDRFGTAALAQLANAATDDPRWDYETTLQGIKREDRQSYIDAAKTIRSDSDTVKQLAGDDEIMNNADFKNWISQHKPDN